MAKSRKQILQELLDLEDSKIEEIEVDYAVETENKNASNDCIIGVDDSIQKPKKPRTQKQLEAFERAKKIRDDNTVRRKMEQKMRDDEMKKIVEQKLVKKAISIKKKEIKKQAILDEISDDDTPIQKIKEIAKTITNPAVKSGLPEIVPKKTLISFF